MSTKTSNQVVAEIEQNRDESGHFALVSPPHRPQIEREIAQTRVVENLPRATHPGELSLGNVVIPCAVLEDGTRVLTQQGFHVAIGRHKKPNRGQASVEHGPAFLAAKNLEPFITDELRAMWDAIEFTLKGGGGYKGVAFGYRAELLPKVCYVYLDAADAGKLLPPQLHVAEQCRIIVRAFYNGPKNLDNGNGENKLDFKPS